MADFFKQDAGEPASEKIKIGEVEYEASELQGLVADGLFKREVEEKQNTKLDKVMSSFTKLTEKQAEWEREKAAYEEKLKSATAPQPTGGQELTPEMIAAAKAEAKKIGLLTQEDVESYFEQKFPERYAQQRAYDKVIETAEGYAKEINGSDGRPAYVVEDVFNHMKETGIRDPYKAYKDLHEDQLDKWKTEQLSRGREPFVTTGSSTAGSKQPNQVRPTRDNMDALLSEAIQES